MINEKTINEYLKKYIDIDKQNGVKIDCEVEDISLEKLRNALYQFGDILDQNIENNMFIVSMKSGFLYSNQILVCAVLDNNKIHYRLYNASNDIDSKLAQNIVNKINKKLGTGNSKKKLNLKKIFTILLIIILVLIGSFVGIFYKFSNDYNLVANKYNLKLLEYKDVINRADVSYISRFQNILDTLIIPDNGIINVCKEVLNGNNPIKIRNDINYINNEIDRIDENIIIANKIINPSVEYVVKSLRKVTNISDIEVVSDEDKKSDLFYYDGMFKDCAYFTSKLVKGIIDGQTPVEKGTDAGGCVEIYETVEKAHERYDYLMGFDNTIYYSGQFITVGTMIVRTSYLLSDEENNELVNEIIDALIN